MRISPLNIYNRNFNYQVFGSISKSVIPDVKQNNEFYCAPAACANAIMYLDNNTNVNLDEIAGYLKTDKKGTTSNNLCKGINEYFLRQGKNIKIRYSGFRDVDKKYKVSNLPDFEEIKKAVNDNKAVILNLGIYKKSGNIYKRQYGHFVNAVSANSNGLSVDTSYLGITDPYNKISGKHYIKLEKINDGKFIHNIDDNENVLTDNAAGFYEITTKFNYFDKDEVAVLNGAIILSKD